MLLVEIVEDVLSDVIEMLISLLFPEVIGYLLSFVGQMKTHFEALLL